MINKKSVNCLGASTVFVCIKAFGHKLNETRCSVLLANYHFWIEYKALFSSRESFHYLSFKQLPVAM